MKKTVDNRIIELHGLLGTVLNSEELLTRSKNDDLVYNYLKRITDNDLSLKFECPSLTDYDFDFIYEKVPLFWLAEYVFYLINPDINKDFGLLKQFLKGSVYYGFSSLIRIVDYLIINKRLELRFKDEFEVLKQKAKIFKDQCQYDQALLLSRRIVEFSLKKEEGGHLVFSLLLFGKTIQDSLMCESLFENTLKVVVRRFYKIKKESGINSNIKIEKWLIIAEESLKTKTISSKIGEDVLSFHRNQFKNLEIKLKEKSYTNNDTILKKYRNLIDILDDEVHCDHFDKVVSIRKIKYFQFLSPEETTEDHKQLIAFEIRDQLVVFYKYGDIKMIVMALLELLRWDENNSEETILEILKVENILEANIIKNPTKVYYNVIHNLCNYYYKIKEWEKCLSYADKLSFFIITCFSS